jgi:glycosyltransferase involved in cell wall biosynthesis
LEAWASKTPVIAADIGALSSLIQHKKNGYLVAPSNPTELALALEAILDNASLAQKIADIAAKEAQQKYTWQRTVATTLQFIKERAPYET